MLDSCTHANCKGEATKAAAHLPMHRLHLLAIAEDAASNQQLQHRWRMLTVKFCRAGFEAWGYAAMEVCSQGIAAWGLKLGGMQPWRFAAKELQRGVSLHAVLQRGVLQRGALQPSVCSAGDRSVKGLHCNFGFRTFRTFAPFRPVKNPRFCTNTQIHAKKKITGLQCHEFEVWGFAARGVGSSLAATGVATTVGSV